MKIIHLFIDLFCGAGGTTTGVHEAEENGSKIAEVVVCVNHDKNAILSHSSNYPNCKHFTEDIRTVSMEKIMKSVQARIKYWEQRGYKVFLHLWASLECTNFSKAKGGLPRNADSRTLAEHLFRYIDYIKPHFIRIENVEEFMSWGPLDEKGRPISKHEGRDYLRWIYEVQSRGYSYAYKILNSADFGEHTSRKRYFGVFAASDLPITWPEPTHSKNPAGSPLFGTLLKKWKPVKDCLDFSDEGKSIFERKKELSEKTLQRIYAGLVKYVAGGKNSFLAKYNSYNSKDGAKHCALDVDNPSPVVSTQNRLGIVNANFLTKYYSGKPEGKVSSIEDPSGTIRTSDTMSLIQTKFITKYYRTSASKSLEQPLDTITLKDRFSLVQPEFWIDKQYSNKYNHQSIEGPAGCIMSNDKHSLVRAEHFIDKQFSSGGRDQSVEDPAGALLTVPKMNLVKCWIMNTNFNNVGSSPDDPLSTITANRKWHYLMNPSWGGNPGNVDEPCFTIIARQDKAPAYIIMAEESSQLAIAVYESDSETMIKIKEFMSLYNIVDIKMRMLKVVELLKIQGFPEGYKLIGNQSDQKKFIGNSVTPKPVKYMIEECHSSLKKIFKQAA